MMQDLSLADRVHEVLIRVVGRLMRDTRAARARSTCRRERIASRMRFLLVIALVGALLISSCTSCNPSNNRNGSGNLNSNGNSNSPLALETPAPAPTPSSTLDPNFKECNPYYPLIPGSQASYSVHFSTGLQANAVVVVDQSSEGGAPVFVQRLQVLDKSGGLNKSEMSVQKFVCDKGRIRIISENRDNSVEGHKTASEMHFEDPAYVMLEAAALKPGATWSYSFTYTLRTPDAAPSTSDRPITFLCTVEGEEEVTVPAGKFKAMKVTKKQGKTDVTEYYGPGMGMVKRVNGDGTTWELSSYSGLRAGG